MAVAAPAPLVSGSREESPVIPYRPQHGQIDGRGNRIRGLRRPRGATGRLPGVASRRVATGHLDAYRGRSPGSRATTRDHSRRRALLSPRPGRRNLTRWPLSTPLGEQVAMHVQRHLDGPISQTFHDRVRVGALGYEQTGERVAPVDDRCTYRNSPDAEVNLLRRRSGSAPVSRAADSGR